MISTFFMAALLQGGTIQGTVHAEGTRDPVPNATVRVRELRRAARPRPDGTFVLSGLPAGEWRVDAAALGFRPLEVTVQVPEAGTVRVDLELTAQPLPLTRVEVRGRADPYGGAQQERELFDQEPRPGVIGVSRREIRALPATAEPDVLRALQSLPGVAALNDLNAQLHVRGGGPDQNLFLLDGARVWAPYHLFGVTGVFNTDAVGRVEFHRGSLPARYGGALSAVVDLEQRSGEADGVHVEGGVSSLTGRAAVHGASASGRVSWMLAARSSEATVGSFKFMDASYPSEFHDVHGRLSLVPASGHTLRASVFTSQDRFSLLPELGPALLTSDWANRAASLRWDWDGGRGWTTRATAWASGYTAGLAVGVKEGEGSAIAPANNGVAAGGVRLEAVRAAGRARLSAGVEAEGGSISLDGSDLPGGYMQGSTRDDYLLSAVWAEADTWVGRVRLAPGLRVAHHGGAVFVEPRVSARLHLTPDVALTAGAGRSHQVLSTLRDERQVLPGAIFWFVHPRGAPASRTDGVSAAVEGWLGRAWSFSAGGYARRFKDVVRWMPEGTRELSRVEWDDGTASGVELSVRRHAGPVTGWVGYGVGRVRMRDERRERDYDAAWDRRHALDAAVFVTPVRNLTLSSQATYGSGMPFWPWAGNLVSHRLQPIVGQTPEMGVMPLFANTQMRYPDYFRWDAAARYTLRIRGLTLEPSAGVRNLTRRGNVFYYRAVTGNKAGERPEMGLVPVQPFPSQMVFTFGLDARI